MALQIGRKDGEAILFHLDVKTVVLTVRISEGLLRIYRGKRLMGRAEVGDFIILDISHHDVAIYYKSGYDSCQIEIDAPAEVVLRRDDYIG